MAIIFDTKDSVFFVGGRGTKEGDTYGGGGCTKDFWGNLKNPDKTLPDVMDSNGKPLSSILASLGSAACDVITNGSGKVRITKAGQGYFTDCCAGLITRVDFAAVYTDGRYEVIAVDGANGDWVDIDETYSADTTCGAAVGGAFPGLQIASDNTDANRGTPNNVDILTNKAETFAAANPIDIDVGGGDKYYNTWKRIIGIDDDGIELANGSWVTIDANSYATHCFDIADVDNICFRHIYAYNTGGSFAGFNFTYTVGHYGFLLEECKATNHAYGIKTGGTSSAIRNFIVVGGTYSGSSAAFWIENVIGGSIRGVDAYSTGSYVLYLSHYGLLIQGCIIRSNGSGVGVYVHSTNAAVVSNCIFYNVTYGISVAHANAALVEYNNVFMVAVKTTGKAINRTGGGIAYSDYSCLWALDGAPSASARWGGSGKPEHAIEEDPDFIDAANGNFRPRNPNVLRGGKPDIVDNVTQMGAIMQKYQFARRAKAANLGRLQIVR
jgi:hypothetical protein